MFNKVIQFYGQPKTSEIYISSLQQLVLSITEYSPIWVLVRGLDRKAYLSHFCWSDRYKLCESLIEK